MLFGRSVPVWRAMLFSATIACLFPAQMCAQVSGTFAMPPQLQPAPGQALNVVDPSYQAQMACLAAGRQELSKGDPTNAIHLLQTFCENYPYNSDGHFWLAIALKQNNNLQGAQDEYARSLLTAKNDGLDSAELRNNLGNLLIQVGYVNEAEYDFRRAIEIDPALAQSHINLGRLLLIQKHCSEALKELSDETLAEKPTAQICLLRGIAYMGMSKKVDAQAWLAKCIELSASSSDACTAKCAKQARLLQQALADSP